jgi:hypothetical protein
MTSRIAGASLTPVLGGLAVTLTCRAELAPVRPVPYCALNEVTGPIPMVLAPAGAADTAIATSIAPFTNFLRWLIVRSCRLSSVFQPQYVAGQRIDHLPSAAGTPCTVVRHRMAQELSLLLAPNIDLSGHLDRRYSIADDTERR